VANAAGPNFDPHLTGTGLGDFAFDDFKRPPARGTWTARILGIKIPVKSSILGCDESDTVFYGGNRKLFLLNARLSEVR
jgi:hypothetical protein